MTEHELTVEVMKLCDELGLLYHHCPNSSRCQGPKGFPDLVIVGEYGLIFAELKSEDGDTSAEQDLWAWTANRAGISGRLIDYAVLRPGDFESGFIRTMLETIA